MNILEIIKNNPQIIGQISNKFGISNDQAMNAIGPLMNGITGGIKGNIQQEGGLQSLMGAISKGNHSQYVDNPETLAEESTVTEGNNILGHLFGGKEKSREIAQQAATESGVDYGITKKILPMLASVAMGGLGKQAKSAGLMGQIGSMLGGVTGNNGIDQGQLGMLTKFLDTDGDGKIMDDVMGMAAKFLKK